MAQTKRKRRTKHRGTAAGTIQARGRTGRPPTPEERKKLTRNEARERRLNTPPTWKSAILMGVFAAGIFFLLFGVFGKGQNRIESAGLLALLALVLYIPGGYYMQLFMYRRRMRRKQQQAGK